MRVVFLDVDGVMNSARYFGVLSKRAYRRAKGRAKVRCRSRGPRETQRGTEIQAWLDAWRGEPVESFVILDDEGDMAHLLPRLVQTGWSTGLLHEHVQVARRLLSC